MPENFHPFRTLLLNMYKIVHIHVIYVHVLPLLYLSLHSHMLQLVQVNLNKADEFLVVRTRGLLGGGLW